MKFFFLSSCLVLFIAGCSGSIPSGIGLFEGKLSDCPKSPNCISSQASDKKHYIQPLEYKGSKKDAHHKLILSIKQIKGNNIIIEKENYIHVEFASRFFKFKDDTEFFFDDKENTIHVRSAARKGYSDFGVNKKRMEKIRQSFDKPVMD